MFTKSVEIYETRGFATFIVTSSIAGKGGGSV
jgi:hypothetical protein